MLDHTHALRLFLAVARDGSFSASARRLNLAVSSITRQIDSLESQLAVRLFLRSTHRLTLTEAGTWLRARVEIAIGELDDAIDEIGEFEGKLRGQLRLTCPVAFGHRYIRPLMPALLSTFPELDFDIEFSDEYRDLGREGFDLAIRVGSSADDGLIAQALSANDHLLCASPAYLARAGSPASVDDLANHACLRHRVAGVDPHWVFIEDGRRRDFLPRGPLESNASETLLEAMLAGHGIGLLPYWMVGEALRSRLLQALLPKAPALAQIADQLYLAIPPHRRQSAKVRALRDYLLHSLEGVGRAR